MVRMWFTKLTVFGGLLGLVVFMVTGAPFFGLAFVWSVVALIPATVLDLSLGSVVRWGK